MKLLILLVSFVIMLSGCTSVPLLSASRMSPEQLEKMEKIMAINKSAGCWSGHLEGASPMVAGAGFFTGCWGMDVKPTINEIIQLNNGLSINLAVPKQ